MSSGTGRARWITYTAVVVAANDLCVADIRIVAGLNYGTSDL
jgi:hypothetical protein